TGITDELQALRKGENDIKPSTIGKKPHYAINYVFIGEGDGMPRLVSFLVWRCLAADEERRVGDDEVVFYLRSEVLNSPMVNFDSIFPWRRFNIFSCLQCIFRHHLHGIDM